MVHSQTIETYGRHAWPILLSVLLAVVIPLLALHLVHTATSIVHSKLDYCNSLFLNLNSTQIQRLQIIQNSHARAVTRTPRHHHITPVLKSLHWLKITERIHFNVLSLTYNSLQSSQPRGATKGAGGCSSTPSPKKV